jgi:hypothetical protein
MARRLALLSQAIEPVRVSPPSYQSIAENDVLSVSCCGTLSAGRWRDKDM